MNTENPEPFVPDCTVCELHDKIREVVAPFIKKYAETALLGDPRIDGRMNAESVAKWVAKKAAQAGSEAARASLEEECERATELAVIGADHRRQS